MIQLFFANVTSIIILFSYGHIFSKIIQTERTNYYLDFFEKTLFGILFLSFFSLFINFFFSINKIIGTAILIFGLIIFIKNFISEIKKTQFLYCVFCVSVLSTAILHSANINMPDAGLYHLPFTKIINESKLIIGSVNIHFRFGHTSIMQYLSALYNNYLFPAANITVPIASFISLFISYLIIKIFDELNKKNNSLSYFIFLILIYSFYSFNRYSAYGNDMPAHISFFMLCIYFLDINKSNEITISHFFKISYLSIFLLTTKTFMFLAAIIPFYFFVIFPNKKKIIGNINFYLSIFLIIFWIIRNLLISGCFLYPIKSTCLNNAIYYDLTKTIEIKEMSEAWSKGYPDHKKSISFNDYNKNFNWLNTWSKFHLKKIIEKLLPFVIFTILLMYIINYINKKKNIQNCLLN